MNPVVRTNRTVTLAGSPAFRDLGGTSTVDGRSVAHGKLFRADALSGLGSADCTVVETLGLRLVCDLRSRDERQRSPCLAWLEPQPRILNLELSSGLVAATAPSLERLLRGPDPDAAAAMMRATYATLPHAAAPFLGALFDALTAGELPVLVHCTAGKDRTGFTIAMMLSALGVPRDAIFDDYLLGSGRDPLAADQPSAHMLRHMLGREMRADEAVLVHGVHRDYLAATFDAIDRHWGNSLNYLEVAAGLDRGRRELLQRTLLA